MTRTPLLPAELLSKCESKGIRLAPARGGKLKVDAPKAALTPDLLAWLKAYKADLLALLAVRDALPQDAGPALRAEALGDSELVRRVAALTNEGLALWAERCLARQRAGEPRDGLPWRALVDVRIARKDTPDGQPPVRDN